ncbi:porin [Glaciimonas sp. PAMC28666]|uniref:porin n=1 Tax=Glaciimonas sp. PAMC28666 TaxID=2807626 RepID=UPI00196549EB|nr:porin [Glaciimonas sp. PAMC28666]QRX81743.1 porin [Glaciimonas sp. PAMC28666]
MRLQHKQIKRNLSLISTTLSITLLACAAGAAQAQSSVTIYGLLDVGLSFNNNVGGQSSVKMDNGIAAPSRLGFRGVEDLGGGLSAIFVLENRFYVDTGVTFPQLFNRGSYVGLKSNTWGALTVGRQFDFFNTALPPDATPFIEGGLSSGYQGFQSVTGTSPAVDNHSGTGLYDNAIKWQHTIGNWSGGLMYGLGSENNHDNMKSTFVKYVAGPLQLGAGWTKDNFSTTIANQVFAVRMVYQIGDVELLANYSEGKETVVVGSKAVARPFELAASYYIAPTIRIGGGVGRARDTNRAGNSATLTQPFMSVRFILSKFTSLYVIAARNHSSDPTIIPSTVNTPGGASKNSSSANQTAVRMGIVHTF